MNVFDHDLALRLTTLGAQGLLRRLRPIDSPQTTHIQFDGKMLLNFSSNDYLGLANHPHLKSAAIAAIERYGAGAGASRLICGSFRPHHELEEALAAFKGTEAALSFSSGYSAAIGTICALMGKEDVLVLDRLVHASIVDAARLCGATLHIFRHNDLNHLESILQSTCRRSQLGPFPSRITRDAARPKDSYEKVSARVPPRNINHSKRNVRSASSPSRTLIVTESIFSMDGDHAPLREIVELKEKYGAWLMVDEAHGTGLYGSKHRGIADELRISDHIEIQMGTLGKAIGAAGGYICGSRALIDYLTNRARPFIFSTAPIPAAAAAATAGICLIRSSKGESRRRSLWARVSQLSSSLDAEVSFHKSAILPLLIGDETSAVRTAATLRKHGIFIPAIRYPTVARGEARLRLTLSARHTRADIQKLAAVLSKLNLKMKAAQHKPNPCNHPL